MCFHPIDVFHQDSGGILKKGQIITIKNVSLYQMVPNFLTKIVIQTWMWLSDQVQEVTEGWV